MQVRVRFKAQRAYSDIHIARSGDKRSLVVVFLMYGHLVITTGKVYHQKKSLLPPMRPGSCLCMAMGKRHVWSVISYKSETPISLTHQHNWGGIGTGTLMYNTFS